MAEPTPTPAPTPTPTPAPTPTPTPSPTPAPAAFDWKTTGLDDLSMNLVSERQWKTPGDLVTSYRNLEKLTGVPPEQIIKLPKEMNAATMGEVYDRLGRPKAAAEYNITVPEGVDKTFAESAKGWFHEAGLSQAQAEKVAAKWNEHVGGMTTAQTKAYTDKVAAEGVALKAEWGDKHDANVAIAKQAAVKFGLDEGTISKLEQAMGFAGVHKLMFNIGSKIGEAEFIQGGGRPGDFAQMTPESARAQITANRASSTFAARFNSKDPVVKGEAQAEMNRLHQIAYPGVQTG